MANVPLGQAVRATRTVSAGIGPISWGYIDIGFLLCMLICLVLPWHCTIPVFLSFVNRVVKAGVAGRKGGDPWVQYISLKAKGGKRRQESSNLAYCQKVKRNNKELSMYRLREMDINDKVCEQVSMTMLSEVYPTDVIERCVQHSEPWCSKVRRVRLSTALALVLFVIALGLWSRRNHCQVWDSLVGKLSDLHPVQPDSSISDSGLSGRRKELGSQCMQALLQERCQVIATPSSMPSAFFGRYRLMAIDGTLFHTPDTAANAAAFGRSR